MSKLIKALAGATTLLLATHAALAQDAGTTSRWGKDDQAGASNLMTPKKVM